jgi:hypothetical protein
MVKLFDDYIALINKGQYTELAEEIINNRFCLGTYGKYKGTEANLETQILTYCPKDGAKTVAEAMRKSGENIRKSPLPLQISINAKNAAMVRAILELGAADLRTEDHSATQFQSDEVRKVLNDFKPYDDVGEKIVQAVIDDIEQKNGKISNHGKAKAYEARSFIAGTLFERGTDIGDDGKKASVVKTVAAALYSGRDSEQPAIFTVKGSKAILKFPSTHLSTIEFGAPEDVRTAINETLEKEAREKEASEKAEYITRAIEALDKITEEQEKITGGYTKISPFTDKELQKRTAKQAAGIIL